MAEYKPRYRLESDGTPWGTKVIDLLTGATLEHVQVANFQITSDNLGTLVLKLGRAEAAVATNNMKNEGMEIA